MPSGAGPGGSAAVATVGRNADAAGIALAAGDADGVSVFLALMRSTAMMVPAKRTAHIHGLLERSRVDRGARCCRRTLRIQWSLFTAELASPFDPLV
jgi:hypothetical protein